MKLIGVRHHFKVSPGAWWVEAPFVDMKEYDSVDGYGVVELKKEEQTDG